MYTIKLHDGQEIKGLTKNGNNYVSSKKIDESIFTDNLKTMVVTDDEGVETTYNNVELVQQVQYGDEYYMVFRELTAEELNEQTVNDNVTDIQIALSELYEMIVGGM